MISQIGFLTERAAVAWALFLVFGWNVAVSFAYLRGEARTDPYWYDRARNKLAAAILIICTGELLARAWSAALIFLYQQHIDIGPVENRYPIAFFGSVLILAGSIAFLREFAPRHWLGGHAWLVAALSSIAIAILLALAAS